MNHTTFWQIDNFLFPTLLLFATNAMNNERTRGICCFYLSRLFWLFIEKEKKKTSLLRDNRRKKSSTKKKLHGFLLYIKYIANFEAFCWAMHYSVYFWIVTFFLFSGHIKNSCVFDQNYWLYYQSSWSHNLYKMRNIFFSNENCQKKNWPISNF